MAADPVLNADSATARPLAGRRLRLSLAGRRLPPATVVAAAVVIFLVVVLVVFGQWLTPMDPDKQELLETLQHPGGSHLLGTDQLGRDVFSRMIAGARSAMIGPIVVAIVCAFVGGSLGLIAAYAGGPVDTAVSRLTDVVYALPALLIAIVTVGIVGGGYWLTAGVLIVLMFPYQTRLCRSAALSQARLTYVDAARTVGFSSYRIVFRHLLPNVVPTLLAAFLLDFVTALIAYSALDYLGLGVAPGTADWGAMIAQGQNYITANPWFALGPALALVLTAVSVTLFGDWAYERLSRRTAES